MQRAETIAFADPIQTIIDQENFSNFNLFQSNKTYHK